MLDTIGSDIYPLYPFFIHQKEGTLKDMLEKTETLLIKNKENMTASASVFD